jgi:hypothetical protein
MLSAGFPDKDDVVGAIFEDLLTGSLKPEEVRARVHTLHYCAQPHVSDEIREVWRQPIGVAGRGSVRRRNGDQGRHGQPRAVGLDAPRRPQGIDF